VAELQCACGRPVPDQAYLCGHCTFRLRKALGVLHETADEVETTIARQDRISGSRDSRATGGSDGHPLPVNLIAADVGRWTRTTLTRWCTLAADTRGLAQPLGTMRSLAGFLAGHVDWFRHREDGPALLEDLLTAARAVTRVVDRPEPTWFAGPCWNTVEDERGPNVCRTELYARNSAGYVRCPTCGAEHEVARRREWLLAEAEDRLAHAELLARALTALGAYVTSSSIRGYAHRGRLAAHGTDAQGRPQYRIGDVLDLIRDEVQDRARPRSA
jgi:hypothetical protein